MIAGRRDPGHGICDPLPTSPLTIRPTAPRQKRTAPGQQSPDYLGHAISHTPAGRSRTPYGRGTSDSTDPQGLPPRTRVMLARRPIAVLALAPTLAVTSPATQSGKPARFLGALVPSPAKPLRTDAPIDFDGEGRMDAFGCFPSEPTQEAVALLNRGSAGYVLEPNCLELDDLRLFSEASGDLTSDGVAELIYVEDDDTFPTYLHVVTADTQGVVSSLGVLPTSSEAYNVTIADLEGHGDNDLVVLE